MSSLIAKNVQLGSDPTATNNFTIFQPATPDGTLRVGNGNTGITSSLLTLTSAGNLGIGTSSPTAKLDVYREIRVTQGLAEYRFRITDTDGNGRLLVDGDTSSLIFGTSGAGTGATATERMRIDSSGNVGIGTTSPSWILSLRKDSASGTTGAYPAVQINNANAAGYAALYLNDSTATAGLETRRDTAHLGLYAGGAERARIASNGIVTMNAYGVGTATFSAAGVISSVSDETWKTRDGVPVNPDAMLKKLEPGYWYYNDEKKESFGADRQLGFYAQNVNAAIGPEAAPEPEEGKPWGYYDRSVLAVVVMSLQKALATIESLEARIATLESKP